MYSENDKVKMQSFIKRLILNPCFANENAYEIEENILLFFLQNVKALKATFSTPDFFPNLKWEEIQNLFTEVLKELTDEKGHALLEKVFYKNINMSFVNLLLNRQMNVNNYQNEMFELFKTLTQRTEIRKAIAPALKVISYNLIDNYIEKIKDGKTYIGFEIVKVEKLKLPIESFADYIKLLLMISMIGFIRNDIITGSLQARLNLGDLKFNNTAMQKAYYEKLTKQYTRTFKYIPLDLLQKSFKMHMSFNDDPLLPATARMAKIFYSFGKSYKPNIKVDKGAETFAKSWFQLQRRNYKYYGFDIKMLDELYRISAENYW